MSGALPSTRNQQSRPLRSDEVLLLRALLGAAGEPLPVSLDDERVVDLQDGGMGSIRFLQNGSRRYGKLLAEAQYIDADGVPVTIAVNADDHGYLFELDLWKVDFSPLKRYPQPRDLGKLSTVQEISSMDHVSRTS